MKKQRLFSVCLAGAMLLTAGVTGCGNTPAESTPGTGGSTAASGSSAGEEKTSIYTEPGTYPIVNEPITQRVFIPAQGNIEDFETNDFTVYLEELTGINLDFDVAPSDSVQEKINLTLATNDLPDAFLGCTTNLDDARYGVDEGLLIDLTDLVEQNCPELKNIFATNDLMKGSLTATDGKLYRLPCYNECYHCTYAMKMWANTYLLDEMGVEAPTTTEEFYNVCKQYKESYPDGIPIAGGKNWNGNPIHFIANAFLYRGDNAHGLLVRDGKVETMIADDDYREALRFIQKLYSEGLIYEAAFTTSADQLRAIIVEEGEPILFFPGGASVNLIDSATTPELYSHYYPLAPLEGPDGFRVATYIPAFPSGGMSVTTACQYPEAMVRLYDYLVSEEGGNCRDAGIEGVGWTKADEGARGANGEPAKYKRLLPYTNEPQNASWIDTSVYYSSAERRYATQTYIAGEEADLFSPDGLERLLYLTTKELYEPYKPTDVEPLPTLNFLVEENTELQTIKVELEKYINESAVAFITSTSDINDDKAWKEYTDAIQNIGMETMLKVYQTAYDRQYQ